MCRVLGCVAQERVSLHHELVDAPNPLVHQAETHDSGWGIARYYHGEGEDPVCRSFPEAAHDDAEFEAATSATGRIFNVHVRRATIGGLTAENTHPFCLGGFSFSHNGTILEYPRLLEPGVTQPRGDTDSEALFNFLMYHFDEAQPIESLRTSIRTVIERTTFSALNFLLSDGERLYAYRLGTVELHWLSRPGQVLLSSERLTEERWHDVRQDVLVVCDPNDPDNVHAERLVGDDVVARARIDPLDDGDHLSGSERGDFAAARAAKLAGTTPA